MTLTGSGPGLADLDDLPITDFRWVDASGDELGEFAERPIAGVGVSLRDAFGSEICSTVTNEVGAYRFEGLPSGDYVVVLTAPTAAQSIAAARSSLDPVGPAIAPTPIQTWTPEPNSAGSAGTRLHTLTGTLT